MPSSFDELLGLFFFPHDVTYETTCMAELLKLYLAPERRVKEYEKLQNLIEINKLLDSDYSLY